MKNDRTTIVLPDELRRRVRRLAAEEGVSMGQYIRDAIEERAKKRRTPLRILGIADSGESDLGQRSGEEEVLPEPWR